MINRARIDLKIVRTRYKGYDNNYHNYKFIYYVKQICRSHLNQNIKVFDPMITSIAYNQYIYMSTRVVPIKYYEIYFVLKLFYFIRS